MDTKICLRHKLQTFWRNFSLQLSSLTQFAKIENKIVIAENQYEKTRATEISSPISNLLENILKL